MVEEKLKSISDYELIGIANNPNEYKVGFLINIYYEIKNRGMNIDTSLLETLIQRNVGEREEREKWWNVPFNLHPNLKLASNLVFGSTIFSVAKLFFAQSYDYVLAGTIEQLPVIIGIVFAILMGYFIRLGMNWARIPYVLLFVFEIVIGAIIMPFLLRNLLLVGIIYIVQALIQFYVFTLLFRKSTTDWYKDYRSSFE